MLTTKMKEMNERKERKEKNNNRKGTKLDLDGFGIGGFGSRLCLLMVRERNKERETIKMSSFLDVIFLLLTLKA
jgi:hypothetical protein